jgi:hypothetical protein
MTNWSAATTQRIRTAGVSRLDWHLIPMTYAVWQIALAYFSAEW